MAALLLISGIDVLFVGELKEVFNAENKKGWWKYNILPPCCDYFRRCAAQYSAIVLNLISD